MKKTILMLAIIIVIPMVSLGQTIITNVCESNETTCSYNLNVGDKITLEPEADPGNYIAGWLSDKCYGTGACTVTIRSTTKTPMNMEVIFEPIATEKLWIRIGGTGIGSVISNPSGINCSSGTCSGTFPRDSKVTITAYPGTGHTFVGWRGYCTGTAACVVTMTKTKAINAWFK